MNKIIETQIIFKSYEHGGRVQLPIGSGFSPHFIVQGSNQLLAINFIDFPDNAEFEKPCMVKVELRYYPKIDYSSLIDGARFEVKEGPKIIGTGLVLNGI